MKRSLFFAFVLLGSTACAERFDVVEVQRTHMAQEQPISKMWFDSDGKRLFAQTGAVVRVWDVAKATVEKYAGPGFAGPGVPAGSVQVAPDLSRSASFIGNASGGTLAFFGADSRKMTWSTKVDRGLSLIGLGVGDWVVATAGSRWRPGNEKDPARLQVWRMGEAAPALDVELAGGATVSPDGRRMAHSRSTREVVIIDLASSAEERVIPAIDPSEVTFSTDGMRLALREPSRMRIIDVATGRETAAIDNFTQRKLVSFPADLYAASSLDDAVFRYDAGGSLRWDFHMRDPKASGKNVQIHRYGVSGDVLVVSTDRDLAVLDPTGAKRPRTLCRKRCYGPQTNLINAIVTSPNGELAAVAAGTSLVLWRTDGSRPPVKLRDAALQEAYSR